MGRRGVLNLNVIAGMPQLDEIQKITPELLSVIDFQPGHQYADFNPATDKMAEYGIAALVAGSVASKMGFFKTLWVAVLAGKKFVVIGAIALFGLLSRIFKRKNA